MKQTKRRKPLRRFYDNEVGDPSFINRCYSERLYAPIEFDNNKTTDKDAIIDHFADTWVKTALFVWQVCQDDDKDEPVGWTG